MEVDVATEMFLRSEEKYEVKCVTCIRDADSKTFAGVLNVNPYRDDTTV